MIISGIASEGGVAIDVVYCFEAAKRNRSEFGGAFRRFQKRVSNDSRKGYQTIRFFFLLQCVINS
jgi:hypothetical protein